MPCPHGVDIPANFGLLSRARLWGLTEAAQTGFARLRDHKDGDRSALACRRCGRCLPKCPNDVPIIEQLAKTGEVLG
jgi:predicted aldo/keto reductase-like oxidoreductase